MKKLLIEISTEELPALPFLKEQKNIIPKMNEVLNKYNIEYENLKFLYTPRRFVFCFNAKEFSKDSLKEFIGAPKEIAYTNGVLNKAGISFCKKAGISENELEFKNIKGKECLYCAKKEAGISIKTLMSDILTEFLESLSFGKSMRWGANTFSFIRPITGLVVMMDDELIDAKVFNIKSEKSTFVHRNITMNKVSFSTQAEYFKTLIDGKVMLNPDDRREIILNEIRNIEKLNGVKVEIDKDLLNEVVAITEYPAALLGSFDKAFLEVAPEVIITSMKENQRYFAVYKNNALSNNFVAISNSFNSNLDLIRKGNEKVLRARLSDALFFWKNDLATGLNPDLLKDTIYMQELGSIANKQERELQIALEFAKILNYTNIENVQNAIMLSKADLRTQMVGEFPELQGIVGSYYAKAAGYSSDVITAIKEQYEYENLPSITLSAIVSLANKFDTLMALFSINKIPNGNKDPYALRRAALSVLKIIINLKIDFSTSEFLAKFSPLYAKYDINKLINFINDRFSALYNVNASYIKAVLDANSDEIVKIDDNIKTLINLQKTSDFASKLSTFKRLANILKDKKDLYCDESKLENDYEKNLYKAYKDIDFTSNTLKNIESIFDLKPQIDEFFENVMINVDDLEIKNNRLALVYSIYTHIAKIANLKEISFDD